tara:strand:+ start:1653 stop:1766 length:114 start_codon:yes stop_codon:yes gene_type:complete
VAIFEEEDGRTVRSLGWMMAGFFALTVILIIAAYIAT